MPNHIHGIIVITEFESIKEPVGAGFTHALDTGATAMIAPTKTIVSNECLKIYKSENRFMGKLLQRNYYEHIIRDEPELEWIREYIINNPANWQNEEENK